VLLNNMEYDVTELVKQAIRSVLIRELRTDMGALGKNDWNWVKEHVVPGVCSILKDRLPESQEQIEYYVRKNWGAAKGDRIEREYRETDLFIRA
jgi:hypothetical protein